MKSSRGIFERVRYFREFAPTISRRLLPFTRRQPPSAPAPGQHVPARQRRHYHNPADREDFSSPLDQPPRIVSVNSRINIGTYLLGIIPFTAFCLGCWQVQRLGWKTELIARFEDRLVRDPLPLPPTIDPAVIPDFDYRRVYATGYFRHDQEMLVGPRLLDGEDGYQVFTPLERAGGTKVLVNRGWISKRFRNQASRPSGVPTGEVVVQGLLREPFKRNMFTPANVPQYGEFYFPDIDMMAQLTGSQPIFIEATMRPDLVLTAERAKRGVPIGRPAEVNLRNNHSQYIFTWYSLALATSIMFWMLLRKPKGSQFRVRRSSEW